MSEIIYTIPLDQQWLIADKFIASGQTGILNSGQIISRTTKKLYDSDAQRRGKSF